jgi:hypothetical protein
MPYYTDMREVFAAMGQRQREFNWLLTECEAWRQDSKAMIAPFVGADVQWFSGDDLTRKVSQCKTQFIWGVFSGFPLNVSLDLQHLDVYPCADGNPDFWTAAPKIQHPLAEIEIVCWDSSATLLLCRDHTIASSFRTYFPEAVDLDEYNRLRIHQGT